MSFKIGRVLSLLLTVDIDAIQFFRNIFVVHSDYVCIYIYIYYLFIFVCVGSEWYIENVFEELDSDNEFFYEPTSGLLYYKPNSTSTDTGNTAAPPPRTVEAPMLAELIVLKGSIEAPVKNVTITGITFTGQR